MNYENINGLEVCFLLSIGEEGVAYIVDTLQMKVKMIAVTYSLL